MEPGGGRGGGLAVSAIVAVSTATAIAASDQSGFLKSLEALVPPVDLADAAKRELVKQFVADLYHVCRDDAPMMLHWTAEVSGQFWAWVLHVVTHLMP